MNILVPDSWLREHLKTKATVKQVADYLSLSSQSVEKITPAGADWIYDIEITTNRPDCLSVYGLARELAAILPRAGLEAKLKPLTAPAIKNPEKILPLAVKIVKASLCPRFAAVIFDRVKASPSTRTIRDHLTKAGIRSLNNVVDIANYLMLELGQPMHTFDYDKIKNSQMILRESRAGESIITLDGIKRDLPAGSMIIEDGEGRIIDLCGVMGGKNSAVDQTTQRVVLFVQTYDPVIIRRECQKLNFRTEAAARFEKGVDPEGVITALQRAVVLFEKNCQARLASKLIDIYPQRSQSKIIKIDFRLIEQQLGVKISEEEVVKILWSLGFSVKEKSVIVPHWRHSDINIPEDLVEEIARLYGYHRLPSLLITGEFPQPFKSSFNWEEKIKDSLQYWGFTEVYTYSLQSTELMEKSNFNPAKCLHLVNPLTHELEHLRTSLIPSLLQVTANNQNHSPKIKMFELAHIYLPASSAGRLPEEKLILTGVITGKNQFYSIKGVVEAILDELGIKNYQLSAISYQLSAIWHPVKTALVMQEKKLLGIIGEIQPQVLTNFGIKQRLVVFNLDAALLFSLASDKKTYVPLPQYPAIIEDLCFLVPAGKPIGELIRLIEKTSRLVRQVELIDRFQDQRTFRITYQDPHRTLTDQEIEKVRQAIIKKLKGKQINLKS